MLCCNLKFVTLFCIYSMLFTIRFVVANGLKSCRWWLRLSEVAHCGLYDGATHGAALHWQTAIEAGDKVGARQERDILGLVQTYHAQAFVLQPLVLLLEQRVLVAHVVQLTLRQSRWWHRTSCSRRRRRGSLSMSRCCWRAVLVAPRHHRRRVKSGRSTCWCWQADAGAACRPSGGAVGQERRGHRMRNALLCEQLERRLDLLVYFGPVGFDHDELGRVRLDALLVKINWNEKSEWLERAFGRNRRGKRKEMYCVLGNGLPWRSR